MGNKKKTGEELAKLEQELFDYSGEDRIVSSHELSKELDKTEDSVLSFSTGIESMDRILEKVEAGEIILVTGPTGEGKTTLLMTITKNMIENEVKSAWFTLEVTPRQFISKIKKRGGDLPLFYMPAKNLDNHIKWIEERIIEAVVKFQVNVIFIDHLHEIFNLAQVQDNTSLQIGHLMSLIKSIAIQHNLVVFMIAHSKDNTQRPYDEPRKEDIRDSGLIVRVADTVIGIWRVRTGDTAPKKRPKDLEEHDNWAKVKVLKNRGEGTVGSWLMVHDDHYLKEIDPETHDPLEGQLGDPEPEQEEMFT